MSASLLQLELLAQDRIESFAFFDELTVLVDPRKNIVAEIQTRIAKLKTLIAPKVITADDNHPNVHGVYFDDIRLVVGVFQNPLLKGDDPEPWEICEEIHKAFKNWTPDGWSNAVTPVKPGIEQIPDARLNIFNNNFATKGGFIGELAATATPVITADDDADKIVITCATAGAVIFYTLDGSKPTTQSNLYLAPVTPPGEDGNLVKARAWLPGRIGSAIATATLDFHF